MKTYNFNKIQNLKFGENAHQQASLYSTDKELDWTLLNGSEILYEDFLNASLALEISAEFYDVNAITIVKHQNPIVVALANNLENALSKALDSDPTSPFGGTLAFSKKIDSKLAKILCEMPINLIIAPDFEEDALAQFKKIKNIKIIKVNTPLKEILSFNQEEIKQTPFGTLIQEKNTKDLDVKTFKVITKKKPTQQELEDMIFAYKIAKHSKSCCAIIAKDLRTIGICQAQGDYDNAIEVALNKVCDSPKDSIAALDGVLSSKMVIQIMAQNRLSALIQSAGSIKDKEIIECSDKYEISIVSTGITHYKH